MVSDLTVEKGLQSLNSVVGQFVRHSPLLEGPGWIPKLTIGGDLTIAQRYHYVRPIRIFASPLIETFNSVRDTITTLELALDYAAENMPWHLIGAAEGFPVDFSHSHRLKHIKINNFLLIPALRVPKNS